MDTDRCVQIIFEFDNCQIFVLQGFEGHEGKEISSGSLLDSGSIIA